LLLGIVLNKMNIYIYISRVSPGFPRLLGPRVDRVWLFFLLSSVFYLTRIGLITGSIGSQIDLPGWSEFNNYDVSLADYLSWTCLNLLDFFLLKAQYMYVVLRFVTNCVIANFCMFVDVWKQFSCSMCCPSTSKETFWNEHILQNT
jgi:hypothetical protein